MTSTLDRTTALQPLGNGSYERDIDTTWWGWNGQFGGYVLALALAACRLENTDANQRERSLQLHFMRRFPEGRFRIDVVTARRGRTVTTFTLSLSVDDKLCGVGLAMFGSDRDSEDFVVAEPPDLTLPLADEVVPESPIPGEALQQFKIWPRHEATPFTGAPVDTSGGWMKLVDRGGADERFLLMAADGYVPVAFLRLSEPAEGGTLDFTAHFREAVPDAVVSGGEPVRVELATASAHLGYIDEDCRVWSADGRLLLISRQSRYSQRT